MAHVDIIGEVRFMTTDEGGRKAGVHSGYRPHFKIASRDVITSSEQSFRDRTFVDLGQTIISEMMLLGVSAFEHALRPGDEFTLQEASKVVARGRVIEVLNPRLNRQNSTTSNSSGYRYMFFTDPAGHSSKPVNKKRNWLSKALVKVLKTIIPLSNPEQDELYEKVRYWKVEYDLVNHLTSREIGFDLSGKPIVAAPLRKDMGLWTDEDLTTDDYDRFEPTVITQEEFEEDWKKLNP